MPGSSGIIYRQFSLTIVAAMLLSALVALTFSPALCALLLKPTPNTNRCFHAFNLHFEKLTNACARQAIWLIDHKRLGYGAYFAGLALIIVLFRALPTSFVPDEDQGAFYGMVQLPHGASMERTEELLVRVRDHILANEKESVENVLTVAGYSFFGASQNIGQLYIVLKDWDQRKSDSTQVDAILSRLRKEFADVPEGRVVYVRPATIREMANSAGFEFELLDMAGMGHGDLIAARDQLLEIARKNPNLFNVRSGGLEAVFQYDIKVAKGVDIRCAIETAVKQRFRPVVMTSLAFVLVVVPLALNSGAGSGAQNLVGITVIFGVLTATVFGLYLTPLFFMTVSSFFVGCKLTKRETGEPC